MTEDIAVKDILVCFIVDESGSMESCRDDVIGGFNAYLRDVGRQDGRTAVSLTKFNTTPTVVTLNTPIAEVSPLSERTYTPGGMTALLDAVGGTILAVDRELATSERPVKVLVVIVTDGYENASTTYSAGVVKELIEVHEARGSWTFVYLGANHDAWAVGETLGIAAGNRVDYAPTRVQAVMEAVAEGTSRYRVGRALRTDAFVTGEEKSRLA